MNAIRIFEKYTAKQGWNISSQRMVLGQYVKNQMSDDALADHFSKIAADEGTEVVGTSVDDVICDAGWSDETVVSLVLDYISNQESNDVFEDYLSDQADFENSMSVPSM